MNNPVFTPENKRNAIIVSADSMVGFTVDVETLDGIGYTGVVEDNVSAGGLCVYNGSSVMVCASTYAISYYETRTRDHIYLAHEGKVYKAMFPKLSSEEANAIAEVEPVSFLNRILKALRLI